MVTERRVKITVKVPETVFRLLEKKRDLEKTSLQAVGEHCFKQWLKDGPEAVMIEAEGLSGVQMQSLARYARFLRRAPGWLQEVAEIIFKGVLGEG
jgi:hypothetical protein